MAVNPLMVVVLPVAYLLIGTFSLLQFSAILQLISQGAVKVRQMKQLAPIEPGQIYSIGILRQVAGPTRNGVLRQGVAAHPCGHTHTLRCGGSA